MIYTLSNNKVTVAISDLGAEIQSVLLDGKERVWQNENGSWSRHCPVLFPVCGRSSVIIDGKNYGMPRHGFARDLTFDVEQISDSSVTFVLKSCERTLAVYPFRFELRITYTLKNHTLSVRSEIVNIGNQTMRFALGRHDSFLLDEPLSNYELRFSEEERFLSRRADDSGRLADGFDDFGKGSAFPLPEAFLHDGRSVIFENVNSDSAILKKIGGDLVASIYWGEIKNIVLWRPGDANMICIEPWSALPDRANGEPDFLENRKFFALRSGERKEIGFEIQYYNSGT